MDSAAAVRRRAVLAFAVLALLTQTGATAIPWMIDRDASRIEMSVQAFGGSHSGRFADWRGDIVFDPTDPEGTRATVVVQSASLAMSPAVASRRATGPAFLDAARYPQIRFDLRALEPLGGDRYTAHAEVTMKGITRAVAFPVDLRVTGDRAHLTGAFVLNRADFGIGTSGPWNRLVGRQVTVRVALQARRA
ncbi:YceI family protein [Brevundimonas sp.]|uniref:YceI family protein n=1 Tax=Brevundimonas sp. TaxID=1871086 RepID=UPI003F702EBD